MASFQVEAYRVRLDIQRVGNPVVTQRNRILEIIGIPAAGSGIVERAVLNFSTSWDDWTQGSVVGIHNVANPAQPVLTGWMPSSEFPFWYDVLRSERPLTLSFNVTPIGGASYVNDISLGTSAASVEPIGEGSVDLSP
jgi:hypothetical protein